MLNTGVSKRSEVQWMSVSGAEAVVLRLKAYQKVVQEKEAVGGY